MTMKTRHQTPHPPLNSANSIISTYIITTLPYISTAISVLSPHPKPQPCNASLSPEPLPAQIPQSVVLQ